MSIVLEFIIFLVSIIILDISSDLMIKTSVKISRFTRIGQLSVGFLILSVITIIPEFSMSMIAISTGDSEIAIGTILGSLITHLCLILGLVSIKEPLDLNEKILKKLLLILSVIAFIIALLILVPVHSKFIGFILIVFFFLFFYHNMKRDTKSNLIKKKDSKVTFLNTIKNIFLIFLGFVLVLVSARFTINSGVKIARILKINEFFIGSTLIALGASIPELAVSWSALKKRHENLLVGNIIGSSFMNITLILGLILVLSKNQINLASSLESILFVSVSTILLWIFLGNIGRKRLDRFEGFILLFIYLLFVLRTFIRIY